MSRRQRRQAGARREFEQEARRLVEKPVAAGPADEVRISIPGDHPFARELVELSGLLATHQKRLVSGLEVVHRRLPDAERRILELLARMGVPTDRILHDLGAAKAGEDPLLKVGLGLLHAASAITGRPEDGKKVEELLRRAAADKKF
jgi:hypothetical protein